VHCEHGCIAEATDVCAAHPDAFASEDAQLANAKLIAQLPRLLEICREQAARIKALEARYAWIDSGFGDLDFHRTEMRHKGPKRGSKASYYWMRVGVEMVIGTKK
jgi:hypothetical protein